MNEADSPRVELQIATEAGEMPAGADIGAWVRAALRTEVGARRSGTVSVRLVGREESAALNQSYRGRSKATNVLAFPGPAPELVPPADRELGDLAVCLPLARAEAREQGKTLAAHLAHLIVHGTLHLLGHDHQSEAEARRMEQSEVAILQQLGFADPYGDR